MHNCHLFSIIICNEHFLTAKQTDAADDPSTDVGIIVGSVVGGIIVLGGVSIGLLYFCHVKTKYVIFKILFAFKFLHLDILA